MSNLDRLIDVAKELNQAVLAEVLDFAEFARMRDAERKRQAFDEWAASCPEDDEPVSPELAAKIDASKADYLLNGGISIEELRAELGDGLED